MLYIVRIDMYVRLCSIIIKAIICRVGFIVVFIFIGDGRVGIIRNHTSPFLSLWSGIGTRLLWLGSLQCL